MNYITTTQLRTKTSHLVSELQKGKKLMLMHRSKVIGEIGPAQSQIKVLNAKRIADLKKAIEALNLPATSYAQREKIYREQMEKKHGKGLSRH